MNMVVHYLRNNETPHSNSYKKNIFFNKYELNSILSFYGKKVSQGLLKDYAIDHLGTQAVFSFYRNTFESAYLQIHKNKKNSKHMYKYCLINSSGAMLKQNEDLEVLINYIDNLKLAIIK